MNKKYIINNILKPLGGIAVFLIWIAAIFFLIHFIGWLWEATKFK